MTLSCGRTAGGRKTRERTSTSFRGRHVRRVHISGGPAGARDRSRGGGADRGVCPAGSAERSRAGGAKRRIGFQETRSGSRNLVSDALLAEGARRAVPHQPV